MKMSKVRMQREALKELWFSIPRPKNIKDIKVIELNLSDSKYTVKVISDTKDGYWAKSADFNNTKDAVHYAIEQQIKYESQLIIK